MQAAQLTNEARNALISKGYKAVVIQQYATDSRECGEVVSKHKTYEAACKCADDKQRVEWL